MAELPLRRTPLSAGKEIDAWCTRCKMDLGHRIVAMVGPAPKRVVCMTCGSEHNYRAPKSEDKASSKSPRAKVAKSATAASPRGTAARAAAAREDWEKHVRSGAPVRRYGINETFKLGDIITHKKFGDGFVADVTGGKISVAFADGERTLVHGVAP